MVTLLEAQTDLARVLRLVTWFLLDYLPTEVTGRGGGLLFTVFDLELNVTEKKMYFPMYFDNQTWNTFCVDQAPYDTEVQT